MRINSTGGQGAIGFFACLLAQVALAQTEPVVSVVGPVTPVFQGSAFRFSAGFSKEFCSGTVTGPYTVLTAAH